MTDTKPSLPFAEQVMPPPDGQDLPASFHRDSFACLTQIERRLRALFLDVARAEPGPHKAAQCAVLNAVADIVGLPHPVDLLDQEDPRG